MSVKKSQNIKKLTKAEQELEDIVCDTAANYTCLHETASDFAWECGNSIDDLDNDILFGKLAQEIWAKQPGESENMLTQVITEILKAREDFRDVLIKLEQRFNALVKEEIHTHLEPVEDYQNFIRERVRLK